MVTTEHASPGHGRSMQIEVGGRTLTVRSDAPEARVQAVVAYVNERLAHIRRQTTGVRGALSADQLVLMVALNMAEELFTLRERHQALKERVQDRGQRLLETLDQLASGASREPRED